LTTPSPTVESRDTHLRAFLFDSWYGNEWSGVISLVKIFAGKIKIGDVIRTYQGEKEYTVTDVGIMYPEQESTGIL
jgi:translation elongation factor EF-4